MNQNARRALFNSRSFTTLRRHKARRETASALLLIAAFVVACNYSAVRTQNTMPPEAQAVIDAFSKDMAE